MQQVLENFYFSEGPFGSIRHEGLTDVSSQGLIAVI